MLWDEVLELWPVRLLRAAAEKNEAERYKRLLHFWLLDGSIAELRTEGVTYGAADSIRAQLTRSYASDCT